MKYKYFCVRQNLRHEYIGNYTSYGIALNDKNNILQSDVCCDKELAETVVTILNQLQIEPVQVKYIVEDMVYSE